MGFQSLTMYISPLLLGILYAFIGFSEAAPRISPYDASAAIARKPASTSDTLEKSHTDMPHTLPESDFSVGPLTGPQPSSAIVPVAPRASRSPAITIHPPTTDPTATAPDIPVRSGQKERVSAAISKAAGAYKRAADAQTSLYASEKILHTMLSMVSMVTQRSQQRAWAAERADASLTSIENIHGGYPLRDMAILETKVYLTWFLALAKAMVVQSTRLTRGGG